MAQTYSGNRMIDKAIETDNPFLAGGLFCCAMALSVVAVLSMHTRWGRDLWWQIWIEPNIGKYN